MIDIEKLAIDYLAVQKSKIDGGEDVYCGKKEQIATFAEALINEWLKEEQIMIQQNRWVERGTTAMFLVGNGGKIIAEIHCIDFPMIWTFKNDKYISKEAAQEAAQKTLMPND